MCCNYCLLHAQVIIKGTVYDRSQLHPVQAVSVLGNSGIGTLTDSLGRYSIRLASTDSIYFSYLGKTTAKFAVNEIVFTFQFDMSIDVDIVDSLQSISVMSHSYESDSLANRKEYEKIFGFGGNAYIQGMKTTKRGGVGVGLDMDNFFSAASNRRTLAFQQRLVGEEQDKYIDHRFTKAIVKRVTGLEPPLIDSFMRDFRPTYEYLKSFTTDLEFYKYILDSQKIFLEVWKDNHPDK